MMQQDTYETTSKSRALANIVTIIDQMETTQLTLLGELIENYANSAKNPCRREKKLSSREIDVLTLVANGYTRREIAHVLGIAMNTAARHISNIYQKIGVSSVAEATQYAYTQKLCLPAIQFRARQIGRYVESE